jgi:hypothetical protein
MIDYFKTYQSIDAAHFVRLGAGFACAEGKLFKVFFVLRQDQTR